MKGTQGQRANTGKPPDTYLLYLTKFFKPVRDLATTTNALAQAAVGVERVRAILDADEIIPEKSDALTPATIKGDILFEHVALNYTPEEKVLGDVSFHIKPGQLVGVVGPTGSGKPTVVSLIPRFYHPSAGRVIIDGLDARDYKLDAMRDQIGYVLQDTVLFRGTIAENIAFGRPGATRAEIVEAARLAKRGRLHLPDASGVRHYGWRSRFDLVGRTAPTHWDCPSHDTQ